MTLRLILTRHAKSSWAEPGLGDHERPLSGRGRRAARAIGDWLEAQGYAPGQALISSATRTRETWERIAARLAHPPAPEILPALYLAEPGEMLTVLQEAHAPVVMLVAHNPGCARLAHALATAPPGHPDFLRYPTGATTVLDFALSGWQALAPGAGKVVDFVIPRKLT